MMPTEESPTRKTPEGMAPSNRKASALAEGMAVLGLVASAVIAFSASWRRWPDPVIDAGHQLYTAWRLSEGALLYRDVGCLYGPLSSYLNALLFRLFGPGMMVLVWANLAIYAGIGILCYHLFRAVYGALAAVVACSIFVWVFSFNQLVLVANYTYALPYAHESTHGVLITLALVLMAERWVRQARPSQALLLGLLCGLALLLKPEFILVSTLVMVAAAVLRWQRTVVLRAIEVLAVFLGALTPMALFVGHFWWVVLVDGVQAQVWRSFSGTDAPARNLWALIVATTVFLVAVACTGYGARRLARGTTAAGFLVALPCALAFLYVHWMRAASCVPLTLLLVLAVRILRMRRSTEAARPSQDVLGLFLALAALALLLRMFLNPTLFHFGFYQAALATMVVVAELIGVLREAAEKSRSATTVTFACVALVLFGACFNLHSRAREIYAFRSLPVGQGRDQFLAFSPQEDASGLMVNHLVEELRSLPSQGRLLVVPEGLMVNYLTRRKSPVTEWIFIDLTLANGGEARIVDRLTSDPPEYVAFISRDLREHGIAWFGAPGQPGQHLLEHFRHHYRVRSQFGDDPFDPNTYGAVLLELASP